MKTTVKKWGLVISLLGVVTLAACGNQEESTGSSSKGAEKVEQAIAISLPAELVTLDTTQTTDKNTFTIAQHLFEGLYRLDDKSVPVPGLAKEEAQISEDGLTYTFKLREDAKWSNGDPITADDFVFAWKRLVDPASGAPNAYLLDNVKNSKEIRLGEKAVDDIGISAPAKDEFKVELINPQASFLTLISIVWLAPQQEAYVTEQGADYASDGDHLLASGPFTITDWELGSDTWTLKPNPEYYDKEQVKLQEIKGTTVKEENTGINLFSAGDLDLTRISGAYVAENANDEAFISHSDISNFFLDFNKKEGTPLANVNLRKAIAYAIDKEPLTASTLNDGAKPLNGLVPENLFVNQETQTDFRKYSGEYATFDQEKAKKFWKEAQKEVGDKVELKFLVSDDDNGKKVSEYIQSQIEETLEGVKITITPQPKNNVNQSRRDKDYELSFSGWNAGDNNLGMFFILYETDSAYNYGSYSNPEYDKLAVAAKTTDANDVDKQFADYKAAEKILLEADAAQVPLYQSASNYLINPKIKDVAYPTYGNYFGLRNAYVE
ncbi:peptide ABC transporter substrate-binding protein [Vagococcus sp. BWB3-3]|uniref:Peptide ABC transporter substrate-binding protein n=1 Tax=Vagococcus allomyrinae TaxID=2794353 RepID=A0A940P470_9ENTE|nr:peptide ABC transporter substrate-binding protein [Vagococcus allomyrinae]MBP1041122.1 peptide ABC transporter substrate-binding protein [Vagococcus allomyrinae]